MSARLLKEFKDLVAMSDSPSSDSCLKIKRISQSSISNWSLTIEAPSDCVYAEATFELSISFSSSYPYEPPSVKFITPIYHPNIDANGSICLDIFKMPPKGIWKPLLNVQNVLVAIIGLLREPNWNDPLVPEIVRLIFKEYLLFCRLQSILLTATSFTEKQVFLLKINRL